jgi:hypothetical protein
MNFKKQNDRCTATEVNRWRYNLDWKRTFFSNKFLIQIMKNEKLRDER